MRASPAAFAPNSRARPPKFSSFRGHLCVRFRYGPSDSLAIPRDGCVGRLRRFSFLPLRCPSYRASAVTLACVPPAERTEHSSGRTSWHKYGTKVPWSETAILNPLEDKSFGGPARTRTGNKGIMRESTGAGTGVDKDDRKWPWRASNALQGLFYDFDTEGQAKPRKPPKTRQDRTRIVQTYPPRTL